MNLLARIRPRYRLHVRVRGPENDELVTLYPGAKVDLVDAEKRPTFRVKFHGEDGIEVVQIAPTFSADPATLRDWAAFYEQERDRP